MDARSRKGGPARRRGGELLLGIDTGGTFTDFVLRSGGRTMFLKVASTPDDPSRAVLAGLETLCANVRRAAIVHGSTVATNALVERKGGPTALLTTKGFEDLIEIGRQTRPDLYDWNASRPDPIVPRRLRIGIAERTHADGSRVAPPAARTIGVLGRRLVAAGVRSVAVCFLHSYADGRNERAVGRALAGLGLPVTLSHGLVGEYREYERFSTACANAFLQPVVSAYLRGLAAGVKGRLRVLKSSGLTAPARAIAAEPVHAVLSGPAGGVIATRALARERGLDRVIAFDMGGTSTDVAVIDGDLPFTTESRIGGLPLRVPAVAVETVGAGGGSIARLDAGGALRVGPDSAGADPGPACYGRGEQPTVTDANLLLGRLREDELLGGGLRVDATRSRRALARLARSLGTDETRCAEGVIRIANVSMERALRAVSLQRGHDPRRFALVCYGGAGALHACALAEAIGVRRIIVPPSPGTFSAHGMTLAQEGRDESQTVLLRAGEVRVAELERLYRGLERRAGSALRTQGVPARSIVFERTADARYRGQSHEITVGGRGDIAARFVSTYRKLYGDAGAGRGVEIVTLRVRALAASPETTPRRPGRRRQPRAPRPARVSGVVLDGRLTDVPAWRREEMPSGMRLRGPARVLEYSSTTLLLPGWRLHVDEASNLVMERPA